MNWSNSKPTSSASWQGLQPAWVAIPQLNTQQHQQWYLGGIGLWQTQVLESVLYQEISHGGGGGLS
jgi:hypothetical protein